MKHKLQLNVFCILLNFFCFAHLSAEIIPLDFDEVLATSPYALLLKELISMSDVLGLLQHSLPKDEQRFIEDTVLGKTIRIQHLMQEVDFYRVLPEDIDYLLYWLSIVQHAELAPILSKQIQEIERNISLHAYK